MHEANEVWQNLLGQLLAYGRPANPSNPAGATIELLAHRTIVQMNRCVVTIPARKMGYRFMAAESAWILSGDNRLATIAPFARRIGDTSDDGLTFRGAYGPKFVDQVGWVVDELLRDHESRRAVSVAWRERPAPSRDTPCTVALQWLIRDQRLHCSVYMRSSDAWLGWVYDVHAFSMMSLHVLLSMRCSSRPAKSVDPATLTLGNLYLTAGSQHLYERDRDNAIRCRDAGGDVGRYLDLLPDEFASPDDLVNHLWRVARNQPIGDTGMTWLTHLVPGRAITSDAVD